MRGAGSMAESTIIQVTNADLAALINEARVTLRKIDAVADAVMDAIPQIEHDANGIADAVKAAQTNIAFALGALQEDAARITTKVENVSIRNIL